MAVIGSTSAGYSYSTTVGKIIRRALRILGAIATGETPETSEMADAMEALNAMLDVWNAERLMIPAQTENTLTLVAGTAEYTIGPGGDLNVPRPNEIVNASVRVSGTDYPINIVTTPDYARLPLKTTQGITYNLYYDRAIPLGSIFLYPVPSSADSLILWLDTYLLQVTTPGQAIALPPAYADAMVYNLAVRIAPEWGKAATADIKTIATLAVESKSVLKDSNVVVPEMRSDSALLTNGCYSDIRSGGWR